MAPGSEECVCGSSASKEQLQDGWMLRILLAGMGEAKPSLQQTVLREEGHRPHGDTPIAAGSIAIETHPFDFAG